MPIPPYTPTRPHSGAVAPYRPATLDERATALWASLPRELVARFRPVVGRLTQDMIREIQRAVPAYAQPLEGHFGAIMTAGVEQSVLRILDTVGIGGPSDENWAAVFRRLGRVEYGEGRSLDCLQTAYRVGGRVAWRHLAAWGQQQRLPTAMLTVAAEAIFAYVDEISTLSIEGYTAAQAQSAGVVDRGRRRLVELVLGEPPASMAAITKLAATARWRVPDTVSVVVVEQPAAGEPDELTGPHGDHLTDVLLDLDGDLPCLVLSDPGRQLRALRPQLRGRRVCVGPLVPLREAFTSLDWARRAMTLVRRGIIGADGAPITWCGDHLSTLWLLADEFLVRELLRRALAPLAELTAKQRARTAETLLAWLETRGSAPEIARRLAIHPQTVRYRMRQVDKLFGDQLADPDARLDLEIALRADRLLRTAVVAPRPRAGAARVVHR
ncbi:helix-turn-helix domain-containing protein [Actinokineospora terrae]|uniref:PucR C-terminal helix-turn-helix domain-containing protein n=1 Tax=Actinokineospora terrae TaxID=155974 RepID=A0A1H9XNA4_9PSEU|nr:helix-turn-helix domain-containing protein [Actinokineospora terrae]SES47591.1 PucR C-terminal helix-turn-helix domain-containing protein [Actinokineospora terrae]